MEIAKKILKISYTTIFIVFILIAFFITLTSLRIVQGYNFYVVMSGSMQPAIKTGSIVGVKQEDKYVQGDIITVMVDNNPNNTYTHRIVEINDDSYVTKGDANESNDADSAFKESVLGRVFANIPLVGYIVNFAKQPTGFIVMVVVPAILIIALELNNVKESIINMVNKKKDIKSSTTKDEKNQK
jgi:signal peptidase